MNYEEWEQTVPEVIKADSLWKMTAYRLALFLGDLGWHDVTRLMRDRRTDVGLVETDELIHQEDLESLLHNVPLPGP